MKTATKNTTKKCMFLIFRHLVQNSPDASSQTLNKPGYYEYSCAINRAYLKCHTRVSIIKKGPDGSVKPALMNKSLAWWQWEALPVQSAARQDGHPCLCNLTLLKSLTLFKYLIYSSSIMTIVPISREIKRKIKYYGTRGWSVISVYISICLTRKSCKHTAKEAQFAALQTAF